MKRIEDSANEKTETKRPRERQHEVRSQRTITREGSHTIILKKRPSPSSGIASLLHGWRLPVVLFVVALLPRLLFLLIVRQPLDQQGDEVYYLEAASNLLNGEGYREGNLLAYRPPLYPMFLSVNMALLGDNLFAIRLVQSILGALMCLLVFRIGARVYSTRSGVIASLICAIYPQMIYYSSHLLPEQLFMLLVCLAVYLLAGLRNEQTYRHVACGALIGLTALTKEVGLFLLPAYVIWLFIDRERLNSFLLRAALVTTGCIIAIAPWTVRNSMTFNQLVPIATNCGVNMYIGNNPSASGHFDWVLPPGSLWNEPSPNGALEYQVYSRGLKLGIAYAAENPGRFANLVFLRAYYLFRLPLPSDEDPAVEILGKLAWLVLYVSIIISMVLKLILVRDRKHPRNTLLFLIVGALIVPFMLTFGMPPYRLAFMPIATVIAAGFLDLSVISRFRLPSV